MIRVFFGVPESYGNSPGSIWALLGYYEFMSFDVPKEFGVPDEIGDMTRSLEMAEM